jgi:hypothetical protein
MTILRFREGPTPKLPRISKTNEAQLCLYLYLRDTFVDDVIVEKELQFAPPRKWRIDVALIDNQTEEKWAFEIEGGLFSSGRHSRGAGIRDDIEKYNRLAAAGWQLFRFLPEQVLKGEAKSFIEEFLLQQ